MLRDRGWLTAATAVAPAVWGTTYVVTTELLPPDRPLLAATARALPAGLLLLALAPGRPTGVWWWRAAVLGALNIGVFNALLFLGAHRLPGGVAATLGAVQPLLVVGLAAGLLGEAVTRRRLLAAGAGAAGVALLVLRSEASLDPVGVAAALGAAVSMALGVVLTKRWGRPVPLLTATAWQLTAGGLLLLPVTLAVEGLPGAVDGRNLVGAAYLTTVGTALAYALWFRGLAGLPVASVASLGLLSPVVAAAAGWAVLGQDLTGAQLVGAAVVLGAVLAAQAATATPAPAAVPRSAGPRDGGPRRAGRGPWRPWSSLVGDARGRRPGAGAHVAAVPPVAIAGRGATGRGATGRGSTGRGARVGGAAQEGQPEQRGRHPRQAEDGQRGGHRGHRGQGTGSQRAEGPQALQGALQDRERRGPRARRQP